MILMSKVFEALMQYCNHSIPEACTLLNTCGLIVAYAANNSLLHIFRYGRHFLIYNIF